MYLGEFIVKALCVSLCLALSPAGSSEETARDFIEHVLRIPNPDKVLNSVLGRLERNRHQAMTARQRLIEEIDCEDPSEILPEYTESIPASRERELRQLGGQKHYPICHLERKIRRLNTNEYEYRPAYYEEVRCSATNEDFSGSNEAIGYYCATCASSTEKALYQNIICSSLGFSCVQWNKTIHLTRRRYTSDCWETRTMVIPAGCECMWPVHRLGDMALHV